MNKATGSDKLEDELGEILNRIVSQEAITEGGWAEYSKDPSTIAYGNPLHNQEELKKDLTGLINRQITEAVKKEVAHWVTESNINYEIFQMRIAKRYAQLSNPTNPEVKI